MPRRSVNSTHADRDQFFTKELSKETPPSFSTLEMLYELSSTLYGLKPWHVLEEDELVLIRDSATGETCFCSVMGALGEVLAMHAYIGVEGYRLFRKIAVGDITSPSEFFSAQHSVSVEFVPSGELDPPDRKLLTALGHPKRAANASPIFRACRPGFYPWYVTENEARLLADCLRAVILVCSLVSEQEGLDYWDEPDTFPMVSPIDEEEADKKEVTERGQLRYEIKPFEVTLAEEPPLSPAQLGAEQFRQLHGRDYPIRGVMEIDFFPSPGVVGEKNERKACLHVALAVDADSGFLFPPELAEPGVSAGDALAAAITKAIETTRVLPREVRVQSSKFKNCLSPISEAYGFPIKVRSSLPALAEAREHLLRMMGGAGFPEL
jgi:hypothetical protein